VGTRLVHASDQQSDAVRALAVDLCAGLGFVADLGDDAFEGDGAVVGHF